MSRMSYDGVVDAGYWMYMAAVMAKQLELIMESRQANLKDIPQGVYNESCLFFSLIQKGSGANGSDNPPASSMASLIAVKALKRSSQHFPSTIDKVASVLGGYLKFIKDLREPHTLSDDEIDTAKSLQKFFIKLRETGDEERYKRRVTLDMYVPA